MRSSVAMSAASAFLALLAASAAVAQEEARDPSQASAEGPGGLRGETAGGPRMTTDDPVSAAWARYREADFEAALATLAAAEEDRRLSAEDYPRALEIRALAAHALGRNADASAALRELAAVDPDYGLGPEAVPILREQLDAFRRARDGVELAVSSRLDGSAVEVRARVTRDPLSLVQRVAVFARSAGETRWRSGDGAVRVPVAGGRDVEYWAEALGPARVLLARRGSAEDPYRTVVSDEGGVGVGWLLALGGAVVLAAGVVLTVLWITSEPDGTTVRAAVPWDR